MYYNNNKDECINNDILSGRGFDVLIYLMGKQRTIEEISRGLGMTVYTAKSYLDKLITVGMVVQNKDKKYELYNEKLELITDLGRERRIELEAQHMGVMVRDSILYSKKRPDLPQSLQTCFLRAKIGDIEEFTKEIEKLFDKYKVLEDSNEETIFSLFAVLMPYNEEY